MPGRTDAEEMPRLDAFDQEFGREPVAILRGHRRRIRLRSWALICVLLGAGVISALALGWPNGEGPFGLDLQSAPTFLRGVNRESSDEQIDRLRREVDTLKKEIGELTEAQRQAGETIAVLQAAEQEPRAPVSGAYWYSNLAALNFGIANQSQPHVATPNVASPNVAAPTPRRPPRPDAPRRDNGGAPLSLEAPQ
jgi:hypothetical protein